MGEDALDTDAANSETNDAANSTTDNAAGSAANGGAAWDAQEFLRGLDAIFDAHVGETKAEPYLLEALTDAENAGDDAGQLTVLNEIMGFYRSRGRHDDNQWMIQRAMELGLRMRIQGTEAWATTLINAATSMRAAGRYDQATDLYDMALAEASRCFSPADRRLAALHNNISMLYSETGNLAQADRELRAALDILRQSSIDSSTDIDIASTHTNLALVLLGEAQAATANADSSAAADDTSGSGDTDAAGNNTANDAASRLLRDARKHAQAALDIYKAGHLENNSHYASALAGFAQVSFADGDFAAAANGYRRSLAVIEDCYGKDSDYWKITDANLQQVIEIARNHGVNIDAPAANAPLFPAASSQPASQPSASSPATPSSASSDASATSPTSQQSSTSESAASSSAIPTSASSDVSLAAQQPPATPATAAPANITGMQLAREYWKTYGKPLLASKYAAYQGHIAAGLVGHGSECYGFDDAISRDHDFGPGFCLWLTDEDYAAIGEQLQADYDALPQEFMGFGPREATPRAQGAGRRVGVFRIGDFFAGITGYEQAPGDDSPHEWLMLDEPTLAAATNGQVFADPLGAFSKRRQGFKLMPDDVRLSLISRRLGMIAQSGQYNLPRMLARNDGAAAMASIHEFAEAVVSLVFLINTPISAGYMPYYKWRFVALRALSARMAARLPDECARLEEILRLSSAACFGGAGFGEGGKGAAPAAARVNALVNEICADIVAELRHEGLTSSDDVFLEWQRPYVEAHIRSDSPVLHSL